MGQKEQGNLMSVKNTKKKQLPLEERNQTKEVNKTRVLVNKRSNLFLMKFRHGEEKKRNETKININFGLKNEFKYKLTVKKILFYYYFQK